MAINAFSEEIAVKGMPRLDYVILRKPAGECLEDDYDRMSPKEIFITAVNKLVKIQKYHRKKQFKFADLLKYMKEHQMSEE